MKIKEALSWLKIASVAIIAAVGIGQVAFAWSPEPWSFDRNQDEGRSEILEKAETDHRDHGDLRSAYDTLSNLDTSEDDEETMFWRAWYASELGFVDEAKGIYRSLIHARPDDGMEKVLEVTEDLLNLDTKYARYHNALGYLLASEGHAELRRAYRHLDKAIETAPKNPAVLHSYGYALQKDGRLDKAEEHYEAAMDSLGSEFDIDFIFSDYGSVTLLARPGNRCPFARLVKKMFAYRSAADSGPFHLVGLCRKSFYEEMAGLLDRYIREHPNSARPKIFQAMLLHEVGKKEKADQQLNEALTIIRQSKGRFKVDDVEAYGFALQEVGRIGEAEIVLRELKSKEPRNPWHHIRLACLLAEKGGSGAEVRELTNRAVELAPNRKDIIKLQAEALTTRIDRQEGSEKQGCWQ